MSWFELLAQPTAQRVTITLMHFVWQGFAIAVLVHFVLRCFAPRRASVRYGLLLTAMVAMMLSPMVTFSLLRDSTIVASSTLTSASVDAVADDSAEVEGWMSLRVDWVEWLTSPRASGAMLDLLWRETTVRVAQPYLFAAWMLGVAGLSLRLSFSLGGVIWLGVQRQPFERANYFTPLASRLGVDVRGRLYLSQRVREAIVVGFYRPVVLLPSSWITEMPVEVLEAVIAHELAHIRRWDLPVNCAQRVVETLLFYHPAVWWLSRRIRIEREMCCDEMAVTATGDRLAYANALEFVARQRVQPTPALAAAIRGGRQMNLLNRIQNVLGLSMGTHPVRFWPVGLLMLVMLLGLIYGSSYLSQAQAQANEERPMVWLDWGEADDEQRSERRSLVLRYDDDDRREADRDDDRRDEDRRDEDRARNRDPDYDRQAGGGEVEDVDERVYRIRRGDGEYEVRETRRTIVDRQIQRIDEDDDGRRGALRRWQGERTRRSPRYRTEAVEFEWNRGRDAERSESRDRQADLIELIRELRSEVSQLRREVQQLRRNGSHDEARLREPLRWRDDARAEARRDRRTGRFGAGTGSIGRDEHERARSTEDYGESEVEVREGGRSRYPFLLDDRRRPNAEEVEHEHEDDYEFDDAEAGEVERADDEEDENDHDHEDDDDDDEDEQENDGENDEEEDDDGED